MAIFGKPPDTKPAPTTPSPMPLAPKAAGPAPSGSSSASRGNHEVCIIGPQITIKGEITGDEDILVEGVVEGLIQINREVKVGEKGRVKARIEAQTIIISGEVVGDCQAHARVEIQSTGKLTGDIRAPRIVIAEGAMFRGNSDMSSGRGETTARPTGA
jgi:cytoskeletal protein CcmA (bactofilin family)